MYAHDIVFNADAMTKDGDALRHMFTVELAINLSEIDERWEKRGTQPIEERPELLDQEEKAGL